MNGTRGVVAMRILKAEESTEKGKSKESANYVRCRVQLGAGSRRAVRREFGGSYSHGGERTGNLLVVFIFTFIIHTLETRA
jgi:hypothetical protein